MERGVRATAGRETIKCTAVQQLKRYVGRKNDVFVPVKFLKPLGRLQSVESNAVLDLGDIYYRFVKSANDVKVYVGSLTYQPLGDLDKNIVPFVSSDL